MRRAGIIVVATVAALALVGPGAAVAPAAAPSKAKHNSAKLAPLKHCKDQSLVPRKPSHVVRVQKATRCLINRERTRRGLPKVKQNRLLQKSANWQAADMQQYSYFAHARADGPDFVDRVLRFGYASGAAGYEIGENIAWASAGIATARKMVKLWMDSKPHRANLLSRHYRDQAVSALWVSQPAGGDYAAARGPFVIFVNQFGRIEKPVVRKRS